MGIAINKDLALGYATKAVAQELVSLREYANYDRFNNCYNDEKESQIEWMETLLSKLGTISKGSYPKFGYLNHVGRLMKEYVEERHGYGSSYEEVQMAYAIYMEYFVAEGFLEENEIVNPLLIHPVESI